MKNIYILQMKECEKIENKKEQKEKLFNILKAALKSDKLTQRQEDYLIRLRKKLEFQWGLTR